MLALRRLAVHANGHVARCEQADPPDMTHRALPLWLPGADRDVEAVVDKLATAGVVGSVARLGPLAVING
jgi:RNA-splicing ligase RtcB